MNTKGLIEHYLDAADAIKAGRRFARLSAAEQAEVVSMKARVDELVKNDARNPERSDADWDAMKGRVDALGGTSGGTSGDAHGGSFQAALKAAGYDRTAHPVAQVGFKAATFDGDVADSNVAQKQSPALGIDQRYLHPSLRKEEVQSDETGVQSFRQKSRTLADAEDMVRGIAAVTPKPETDTQAEIVNEALHQIATVSTGVPNILLENQAFAAFVEGDLRVAYARAIDAHAVAQIDAANPQSGAPGANILEAAVYAAEAVAAAGYSPSILAASPEDLIALQLLRQPGTDDYVGGAMDSVLQGLRRVAVMDLAAPMVIDPNAAGTLYLSPVRFASFEENAGQTNSSTVRIESNGLFLVQRADAIALLDQGGS